MTTDFEARHPRAEAGTFEHKPQTAPEIGSLADANDRVEYEPNQDTNSGGGETREEMRAYRQFEKDIAYDLRPERPYRSRRR